jgi:hypothetical protein
MKTGTKCRLKYMPETIVLVHSKRENIIWVHFIENDDVNFPVPLSELEEIKEWPKTWEELGEIKGYAPETEFMVKSCKSKNIYATKAQAESALAFAQLSQLHKAIVGDWVADLSDTNLSKWAIYRFNDKLFIEEYTRDFYHLAFQTREQAQFSLTHHRELWEKYWML